MKTNEVANQPTHIKLIKIKGMFSNRSNMYVWISAEALIGICYNNAAVKAGSETPGCSLACLLDALHLACVRDRNNAVNDRMLKNGYSFVLKPGSTEERMDEGIYDWCEVAELSQTDGGEFRVYSEEVAGRRHNLIVKADESPICWRKFMNAIERGEEIGRERVATESGLDRTFHCDHVKKLNDFQLLFNEAEAKAESALDKEIVKALDKVCAGIEQASAA